MSQLRAWVESELSLCVVGSKNVGSLARVELDRGWRSFQRKIVHKDSEPGSK